MSKRYRRFLAAILSCGLGMILIMVAGCGSSGSSGGGSSSTMTVRNSSTYAGTSGTSSGMGVAGALRALELPSDLELNLTFYNLAFYDGSTWQTLVADSTTINLLSDDSTGSGVSVNISALPAGTYTQARLYVTALNLRSASRGETRDLLAGLSYAGVSFNPKTFEVTPFTLTSTTPNFTLYFYMPTSNLTGGPALEDIQIIDGPVVTVMLDDQDTYVATSECATVNVTVNGINSTTSSVYCGFFSSMTYEASPLQGGPLTNNGDGTATGTFYFSPGTFIGGAFETSGDGSSGPSSSDRMYIGSYTAFSAGQSYAYSMAYAPGGFETGTTTGSATVLLYIEPDTGVSISLTESVDLFVGLFDLSSASESPKRVWTYTLPAGEFTSASVTLESVAAGNYYVGAAIDYDGDGSISSSDYAGIIGGFSSPTIKIIVDGSNDFTADPILLDEYSGR